jgi:hypothetical protein
MSRLASLDAKRMPKESKHQVRKYRRFLVILQAFAKVEANTHSGGAHSEFSIPNCLPNRKFAAGLQRLVLPLNILSQSTKASNFCFLTAP